MKLQARVRLCVAVSFASIATTNAIAHPGHEPEDLIHALAHELASPRGILALIVLSVAAALWLYSKNQKK
jgi:hypothetical protein